jgi:hypothetical protein
MKQYNRIESNPKKMFGKSVNKGPKISVSHMWLIPPALQIHHPIEGYNDCFRSKQICSFIR